VTTKQLSGRWSMKIRILTVSAGLACGEAEADAEVALGMGEVGPYLMQIKHPIVSMAGLRIHNLVDITGVKAFAFGFGLKDDAFTFNRFAVEVGEVGTAAVDEVPFVCGAGDFGLLPLKGGMA
jgi:hypothetical protein